MIQQQRQFEFPAQLTTLKLTLAMAVDDDAAPRWIQLERMLDDVAEVSTLTRLNVTLEVDGEFALIPLRTMQPLARLRESLAVLTICRYESGGVTASLTRSHIDLLRSLRRLESLKLHGVAGWSTQALERLVEEPMLTRLQEMYLGDTTISPAHSSVLARFTLLTSLDVQVGDPAFLANLTQLASVSIFCLYLDDPMLLVSALSPCARLTTLKLMACGFTSAHLCALLSSLPLLSSLDLFCMPSLRSLSFASSVGHLARTLRVLSLRGCHQLPPEEVRHLRALTALRSLTLKMSFKAALEDDTFASMMPASQAFDRDVWPHLIRFEYKPPPRH